MGSLLEKCESSVQNQVLGPILDASINKKYNVDRFIVHWISYLLKISNQYISILFQTQLNYIQVFGLVFYGDFEEKYLDITWTVSHFDLQFVFLFKSVH